MPYYVAGQDISKVHIHHTVPAFKNGTVKYMCLYSCCYITENLHLNPKNVRVIILKAKNWEPIFSVRSFFLSFTFWKLTFLTRLGMF